MQWTTLSPPRASVSLSSLLLGLLRRPFCVAACPSLSRRTVLGTTSNGRRCLLCTAQTQQPHTRPINSLIADSKGKSHTELHHAAGHASKGWTRPAHNRTATRPDRPRPATNSAPPTRCFTQAHFVLTSCAVWNELLSCPFLPPPPAPLPLSLPALQHSQTCCW